MQVLYLLTTLDVGGAERSLLELVRRIDRSRIQPVICSLVSGGALRPAYAALEVPVFELGVGPGLAEARGARLVRLLARYRPAIVHSRLILSNLWARIGAIMGAQVICEKRGLDHGRPRFMTTLNRLTQPLCAMNVANSRAVAAQMRSRDRIPERKLRVVYGGVDCGRFAPPPEPARKEFDLVTTTRLEHYKGIFDLIDAMHVVKQVRPATRLSVVGGGSRRAALERRIRDLDLCDAVTVWGERSDVPARLHEARVFVLSSHEEGLPNAVIEAMACELPVVATRVGGTPELVEDGRTGSLVNAHDPESLARAILGYLEAPMLVEAHGRAGRRRALECFDIQASTHVYERLYAELVN
jgi:glycosyltransferase involved in cell wall biosynthesis